MTVEEIKQHYTMRDILSMYGIKVNRSGMASCSFHGADKKPSMKIYSNSCHCFACGANYDVIGYVQAMEKCSFKEAFLKLGGTYEHKSEEQSKLERYRFQEQRRLAQAKALLKEQERACLIEEIKGLERLLKRIEGSYMWFDVKWKIEKLEYKLDCLNGVYED